MYIIRLIGGGNLENEKDPFFAALSVTIVCAHTINL